MIDTVSILSCDVMWDTELPPDISLYSIKLSNTYNVHHIMNMLNKTIIKKVSSVYHVTISSKIVSLRHVIHSYLVV